MTCSAACANVNFLQFRAIFVVARHDREGHTFDCNRLGLLMIACYCLAVVGKATLPGGLVVAYKKGAPVDPHLINSQRPSETVSDRYRDRWFYGTDRQRP